MANAIQKASGFFRKRFSGGLIRIYK